MRETLFLSAHVPVVMDIPDEWQSGYHEVAGTRIHHVASSNEPDDPIVFAHGFTDNHRCLLPVARRLHGDRDVVLVDLRGHGRSDAPGHGYVPQSLAGDVASLCRRYDSPVLYGHSLGAEVAARAAQRDELDVEGLVLEDPPAASVDGTPRERREELAEDVRNWHRKSHASLREEYAESAYTDAIATARKQFRPEALAIEKWPYTHLPSLLPDVPAPTLVLRPGMDRSEYYRSQDAEWEDETQEAKIEYGPDSSHTISRDSPETVAESVRSFLDDE